jgi:dTDP-L-rhamnose 4-epimerase
MPLPTPEDTPLGPTSVYALSKSCQEQAAMIVGAAYQLPVTVLRFFNVYGPRQSLRNPYTGVITAFVTRVLSGLGPEVYEDGLASRDFVHVDDVVDACVAALRMPPAPITTVANVGTGRAATLLEVAQLVSGALDGPAPVTTGKFRFGDIRHCRADLATLTETFGLTSQVSLEQGITSVARWVASQAWEDRASEAEAELVRRGLAGRHLGRTSEP